jgi:ribonuclease HI
VKPIDDEALTIYTDGSSYRVEVRTGSMCVTEDIYAARFVWPRNGWMTREGTAVSNVPLWKELVRAANRVHRRVNFEWVKGHRRDPDNRAVDKLAKASAQQRRFAAR